VQIAAMDADGTIAKTLEKYGVDASAADVGGPNEPDPTHGPAAPPPERTPPYRCEHRAGRELP
jgi:hypothetical protein